MFQNMIKASKKFEQLLIDSANEEAKMSNEIKVGDWTVTEAGINRLNERSRNAGLLKDVLSSYASECCEILGIDPTTDSVAHDIAEEIVLHGTPVDEVVAKLQRHLEGGR
jgi:predicted alpha-1,6-mannanase (GH76 family)